MIGPLMLNTLALAKWATQASGSPQYYRDRPSYRDTDYDGSDRQGDYRMYGELSRVGDYQGGYDADIIDSRSYDRDRYYDRGYRRSFRAEDTCPYDNEKLLRKKRSVNDTETTLITRLKRQSSEGLKYSEYKSRMAERRLYDRPYDRLYDRYDDRYRSDRYDSRYRSYDDRPYDRYSNRYRYNDGRERTYPCGREICTWTAELECNINGRSGLSGRDRVEWRREHDGYYPRDKYRDLMDYCGGRCRLEDDRLVIRDVRPEDKGVYRCYVLDGRENEFSEVSLYPKFPLSSNEDC